MSKGIRRSAAFLLAVDGEGDADAVEQGIRLGAFLRQPIGRLLTAAIANSAGSALVPAPSLKYISLYGLLAKYPPRC